MNIIPSSSRIRTAYINDCVEQGVDADDAAAGFDIWFEQTREKQQAIGRHQGRLEELAQAWDEGHRKVGFKNAQNPYRIYDEDDE